MKARIVTMKELMQKTVKLRYERPSSHDTKNFSIMNKKK